MGSSWGFRGPYSSWPEKSPRGTHLRNGFGESGFETTLHATNRTAGQEFHRSSWRVALLPSGQRVGLQFSKIGQRISTYWNSCPAVRLVACRVVSKPDSPNPLRRWVPLGDFSGQLE